MSFGGHVVAGVDVDGAQAGDAVDVDAVVGGDEVDGEYPGVGHG